MISKSSRRAAAVLAAAVFVLGFCAAEPIASPTWGFSIDLPEGFELAGGDHKNRFSFYDAASSATVDMVAYAAGRYASPEALIEDAAKRLKAETEPGAFDYRGRKAALARIAFTAPFGPAEGWALAVELEPIASDAEKRPIILMLCYGKTGAKGNERRYLSALDSLSPAPRDKAAPGPVSVFSYPPKGKRSIELTVGTVKTTARLDESDAEASKAIVDREFALLTAYAKSPKWKEAWTRFYRMVWRDSYERLADVAFAVERTFNSRGAPVPEREPAGDQRALAEGVLGWVQNFKYERDLLGSDFVDLITAAVERRGDCDSRALLMDIILQHANIDTLLMVSRDYSHAMAAVKTGGAGARFSYRGTDWIVAETTAKVALGMIGKDVADPAKWIGIDFPALPPTGGR